MKCPRVMKILCVLLMLVTLSSATAFAANGVYYVNANSVNVRYGPSSSYSSKGHVSKGDVVSYKKSKNGWYFVKMSNGRTGWIYRKYLSSVRSSSSKTSASGTYKTTANLNMRSKATLNSGYVIRTVKKGTRVTMKKQSHGWAYVTYSGGSGWVSAKYLKKL